MYWNLMSPPNKLDRENVRERELPCTKSTKILTTTKNEKKKNYKYVLGMQFSASLQQQQQQQISLRRIN